MYKVCLLLLALSALSDAKPVVAPVAYTGVPVAASAPLAYAGPGFVTATSSQFFARNFNGVASPVVAAAAPIVAASAPFVAPAAAPLVAPAAASLVAPAAAPLVAPAAASLVAPAAAPLVAAAAPLTSTVVI